jgi:SNF2 family DNA or RNA helicase
LIYSLAARRDGGLESGSSTSVDEHGLVVGSRNGLESVEEEEEHIWNTSSKIDAVVSTLQALPKVNVLVEDGKLVKGTDPFLSLEPDKQLDVKESSAITDVTSELPLGPVRQMVDSTEKAIVFSQWTSMLDLLEVPLKQAGFCYRRLDGTMSVLARDRAVSDFNTRPEVCYVYAL